MKNKTYAPGPKSRLPVGFLWAFYHDPLRVSKRLTRRYGDIVHVRIGPRQYFLLNHPDYIRQVLTGETMFRSFPFATKYLLGNGLLTSQGELHRRQRHLLNPFFHRDSISTLNSMITECAEITTNGWINRSTVDVSKEMLRLTFAVIVKTLFGRAIEESLDEFLKDFNFVVKLTERSRIPFMDHLLIRLPLRSNIRFKQAIQNLNVKIRDLIHERKSQGFKGDDVLSMLLKAQHASDGTQQLSDQQIHDEMMTLLLAGHETISNALTWMWYLLSQHGQVEARLHEELESVLGGRNPTTADLPHLQYGRMVFLETMRLYPPVWVVTRRPTEDIEIGGYHVPAWSSLNMCPFLMHRDSRYFPDPERFDPQRWLPEEVVRRPRFSYFPFGGGPHQCIGEGLAMTEGLLITATIAQKWRLRLVENHPVEVEPLITLRPKYGMKMHLERRAPRHEVSFEGQQPTSQSYPERPGACLPGTGRPARA